MKYTLDEVMTIVEAAERYKLNVQSLKNKFKPSIVGQDKIDSWTREGLVKQSGKTWLLTPEFIKITFNKGEPMKNE